MNLVFDDRSTEGTADLLVLIGQDSVGNGVGRVELVVAEEAVDAPRHVVGPGS